MTTFSVNMTCSLFSSPSHPSQSKLRHAGPVVWWSAAYHWAPNSQPLPHLPPSITTLVVVVVVVVVKISAEGVQILNNS